jgi:voltage-gated potassium channel
MKIAEIKADIRELYEGKSDRSDKFRYMILIGDLLTIAFLIISTFFYGYEIIEWLDIIFGLFVLSDFSARLWISDSKPKFFINPLNIFDLIAVLSFLAPIVGENFAFLRALRVLRLLRSYRLLERLRKDFKFFARREDLIISAMHMGIFIFLMTQLVFTTQINRNADINNFIDAMYFTISSLTTTGYGDVILTGSDGKLISIIIMICGVSLFLRLLKSIFRPAKVRFECTDCGLFLHENDAICCKHCGKVLNIPSYGDS